MIKILIVIQNLLTEGIQTVLTLFKILLWSGFNIGPKILSGHQNCLIMGNGPSLNKSLTEYENQLKDYTLICVNHFAESQVYKKLKPEIYVLNAPEMWMNDVETFYYEKGEKLFDAISKHTDWEMDLFIPYSARRYNRWQEALKNNKKIKIHYFNNTPVEGYKWFRYFCYNNYMGMPRPHNVLIPSIMISLYLKFKKVYLLGTDHSWTKDLWVSEENEVLLNQKHFYDENTSRARPMDNLVKGSRKLYEVLQKFVYAFYGYFELEAYSKTRGQDIVNCTEGSFIDAFKRSRDLG